MKTDKFLYLFCGIFTAVSIVLLVSAVMVYRSDRKFMAEAEEISGVIDTIETYRDSDHDIHHRAYVSYTYNGQQYSKVRVNFYSSTMYEGKEITLYCDPRHPERVVVQGADAFAVVILSVIGIVFLCIGTIPLIIFIRKKAGKKKVRENGKVLYATVDEISHSKNIEVNRRHPYVIYCSYRDDYKDITYRFKSGYLWMNPEPAITVGSTIKVYVEENNYKNYYVDAESMIRGKIVDYT